jgi:hypothetical protein
VCEEDWVECQGEALEAEKVHMTCADPYGVSGLGRPVWGWTQVAGLDGTPSESPPPACR